MARTPLMRLLQRIVRDHAQAERAGVPAEAIVERGRQWSWNRRDFLKVSGAAVGAAAMQGALPAFSAGAGSAMPKVGIMGAGIAGLNAALTLQDKGIPSTLYEASDRVGGRMHSLMTDAKYWENGQTSEWCGELIDSNHKTIMNLAQRFNLPLVDMVAAQPVGSQDTYYAHNSYFSYIDAVNFFNTNIAPVVKNQLHLAPFPTLYNSFTAYAQYLDNLSGAAWIDQFVPGGHDSDFGALLDSAYNQEYGLDMTQQSSLNILYLLAYQPAHQPAGGFAWYGVSDERYHILGGNQQVPLNIADHIQNTAPACTINLQSRMEAIALTPAGKIACTFSTPSGTLTDTFDEVILTMPFAVLRTLEYGKAGFDHLKQTAITQLGYGTNTKMNVQFKQKIWNGTGAWPGISNGTIYTDLPFENTWEATRGQPGSTGIIVLYTGGSFGTQFKLPQPYLTTSDSAAMHAVQTFLQQLDTVWPGVTKNANWTGLGTVSTPWSDPNLLGSYACWTTGQYTGFSGYERVRQGNIHFAGEHCSINFQGFMEGGAEEGARAANEVLLDHCC
jgi:monoamine oxidase